MGDKPISLSLHLLVPGWLEIEQAEI